MALNVTALSNYVSQNSKEFVLDTVLNSTTAKLLKEAGSFMVGVKGTQAIQVLQADVSLQDGSACGRVAAGDTRFSQKQITVAPIADYQNFCPKAMEAKWMSEYLTKGQTYSELLFAKDIMQARASKIAEANEKLFWQGDTANVDGNLNKMNGFLKQIVAGSEVVLSSGVTITTANVIDELQKAVLAMTIQVRDAEDARLFIGGDIYAMYLVALANKNIFKAQDDKTLFGTTVKMEVISGLNGTKEIVLARLSNLVYAVDLLDEDTKASLDYSVETKQFYMDFNYAIGVSTIFGNEIGYAKFL